MASSVYCCFLVASIIKEKTSLSDVFYLAVLCGGSSDRINRNTISSAGKTVFMYFTVYLGFSLIIFWDLQCSCISPCKGQ